MVGGCDGLLSCSCGLAGGYSQPLYRVKHSGVLGTAIYHGTCQDAQRRADMRRDVQGRARTCSAAQERAAPRRDAQRRAETGKNARRRANAGTGDHPRHHSQWKQNNQAHRWKQNNQAHRWKQNNPMEPLHENDSPNRSARPDPLIAC